MVGSMRDAIKEPGFYFFPGRDMSKTPSEAEQKVLIEKINRGPTGILVIHPEGGEMMSPRQLGTELATNVVSALLAALLLAQTRLGFVGRVLFVTGLGLFGFVISSVPFWNWYGFPVEFTCRPVARKSHRLVPGGGRAGGHRPADRQEPVARMRRVWTLVAQGPISTSRLRHYESGRVIGEPVFRWRPARRVPRPRYGRE